MRKILFLFVLSVSQILMSQTLHPLPFDSANIHTGVLPNGLKYYIRHNDVSKGLADFYLVKNVGSVLERKQERGFSHFLEHMAFDGSEHFPDGTIKNYLNHLGIQRGNEWNAKTDINDTHFYLHNVPIKQSKNIDSCILVLKDWCNGLTLSSKDIEKERKVVIEEIRRNNKISSITSSADLLNKMLVNTAYYDKSILGSVRDIIDLNPQTLRAYYKKWYRADLQAIIIVGDIDVASVETKIKTIFKDLPKIQTPLIRPIYSVAENSNPLYASVVDPNTNSVILTVDSKLAAFPDGYFNTEEWYRTNYINEIMVAMMNERLSKISHKNNNPFNSAIIAYNRYYTITKACPSFLYRINANPYSWRNALINILHELERVRQFGFTKSEFEQTKEKRINDFEEWFNMSQNRSNTSYAEECMRNFLNHEDIQGNFNQHELGIKILNNLTIEDIDTTFRSYYKNRNLVISGNFPLRKGFVTPSLKEIMHIINSAQKDKITNNSDLLQNNKVLITNIPTYGKIIKRECGILGTTILTLSNNVKVVLKPTSLEKDAIYIKGFIYGGTSLLPDSTSLNAILLDKIIPIGGIGNFSTEDINTYFSNKTAICNVKFNLLDVNISGYCNKRNFESYMQRLYLTLMSPRKDSLMFNKYIRNEKDYFNSTQGIFSDKLTGLTTEALFPNLKRTLLVSRDNVEKINYDIMLKNYTHLMHNFNGLTIVIVGSLDGLSPDTCIERYLGSLPSEKNASNFCDCGLKNRKGKYSKIIYMKSDEDIATTNLLYKGYHIDYTPRNHFLSRMAGNVIRSVLTDSLREKYTLTYDIKCDCILNHWIIPNICLTVTCQTSSAKRLEASQKIQNIIESLGNKGPAQSYIDNYKVSMAKDYEKWNKSNDWWAERIYKMYYNGIDVDANLLDDVNQISCNDLRDFIYNILNEGNCIEFGSYSKQ